MKKKHFKSCYFYFVLLISGILFTLSSVAIASNGEKTKAHVNIVEESSGRTVVNLEIENFFKKEIMIEGKSYNSISLSSESNKKEVGAPSLPDVSRSLIIPNDAEVDVRVLNSNYYEIKDFDIAPSKGYISREVNPEDVPYIFSDIYDTNIYYPGLLAKLREPYIMRDFRGVVLTFNPFQYNPVQRILRVYTEITVEVNTVGFSDLNILKSKTTMKKPVRAFNTIYSSHFINYPQKEPDLAINERYAALDEYGELLIIVNDDWNDNVQPLKTHKDSLGIPTTIINVSDIPGGSSATDIKAYIQGIYDDPESDLAFVLLVGDLSHVDSFIAVTDRNGESDAKYSKLAGNDDYPEIIVGRLSAGTSYEVDTQVERTIEYETINVRSQDWFWRGLGIASDDGSGDGDDSEWDWEHMRNIRSNLLGYGYTAIDELYEGDQGGADADGNPSSANVTVAVNAGRGIINYCGHGGVTSWSTTAFANAYVNALTNDNMLPFIFDVACLNGNFGESTCFAETWMRSMNGSEPTGAIGIYASSINQPWNPPMEAQDEFNALYVTDSYISYGAYCYAAACSMMDDYPGDGETYGNGHATFNTWIIFGDPSLMITYDNSPPVANAGADQTVEMNCNSGATLILDGSGSYDPNGDVLTYEWTWDGNFAYGESPEVTLPFGETEVTLVVSDGQFEDSDTVIILVEDTTPPDVTVTVPSENDAVQDGVKLSAEASDFSGVSEVLFYVREIDGTSVGYEALNATFNAITGNWEYLFDSLVLDDGYYMVLASALDNCENIGWSDAVPFSIRNWAALELLPESKIYRSGRTMPIKFSLHIAEAVDPEMPFVYNEELEIKIYKSSDLSIILQSSLFGDNSNEYRIDNIEKKYITNFKTDKKPAEYVVEIWRSSKNFLIGSFSFETHRK